VKSELGVAPVRVEEERAERVRPNWAVVRAVHQGAPAGHRDAHGDGLQCPRRLSHRPVRSAPVKFRLGREVKGRQGATQGGEEWGNAPINS